MNGWTRRDAMKSAGALAAGLTAGLVPAAIQPDAAPAPTATATRTLRKAVMLGMIGEGKTLHDKLAIARDAGFEGIEADSPTKLDPDELRRAADDAGITIHGVVNSTHWSIPLNVPDPDARAQAVSSLETSLRDAKRWGSSSILLVPGVVRGDLPYDECWTRSIDVIKQCLPLAKEVGVAIAIENVWNNFIMSPLEAVRYLDEIGDPLVGWHFDIGNIINFGFPSQWVRILGPRTMKLHIKDFSRKKRDAEGLWKGFDVELGDGDAEWSKVMTELDRAGYSRATPGRWATAEVRGGDRARLKQVSEQMDRLFIL